MESSGIDFIGDIHGHADELKELLEDKLGYSFKNGFYSHPYRKVFFVGDFIDRGPKIREVLDIVRPMIDNGSANTIIGNHEFNAICFWTKGKDGSYLREHNDKNLHQHQRTIDSVGIELLLDYVEWFKKLPIYFEGATFRVVHAQWKQEFINTLRIQSINDFTDKSFLERCSNKGNNEFEIIESLLKGEEREIKDVKFFDKDGNERSSYRIKWWMQGNDLPCKDVLFEFPLGLDGDNHTISQTGYSKDLKPVFFGHYWLKDRKPELRAGNVCCLDFSVAKGGNLVAYRWDGEQFLSNDKFVWV